MASRSLPKVAPTKLGQATVHRSVDLAEPRWVQLKVLEWTDEDGKDRKWEVASRKTTSKGGIDGQSPGLQRRATHTQVYVTTCRLTFQLDRAL